MIENEKQYEITKRWLSTFQSALIDKEAQREDLNAIQYELEANALKGQIQTFEEEIKAYEQYQRSKDWISRFQKTVTLEEQEGPDKDVHPRLHQASIDAMKYKIKELEQEVKEYEQKLSGESMDQ